MGVFSWSFANQKLKRNDLGCVDNSCKLRYCGKGYLQCPDGTAIYEDCYEGYGVFGGHDAYDLVVDWNKGHLLEVLNMKEQENEPILYKVADLIDHDREDECQVLVDEAFDRGQILPYLHKGWKRCLGVSITGEDNLGLPYPIKVTSSEHPRKKYKDLPASVECQ